MNKRERILAASVGVLLLALVINFGAKRVAGLFTSRHDRIEELTATINKNEVIKHRGAVATRVLATYAERSLPSNPVLSSSHYRAWLLRWLESCDVRQANVKSVSGHQRKSHTMFTFTVNCEADLRQLVRLLHAFYSQDYLHRIRHMSAQPRESKRLVLAMTIEALAMNNARPDKPLVDLPSDRLAFKSLDDYLNVIVNRNPYSPANQPPKFAYTGTQRGYLNQRMSFETRVTDPENDGITYRLDSNTLPGMQLDERTGQIEWTPGEKGEFEIVVAAVDDGLPAKSVSQVIKLEVTDPPPPVVAEKAAPDFTKAKFAFVTGIIEVNGRPQVWITSRSDGKLIKLFEGQTFEIGEYKGRIDKVDFRGRSVEISANGRRSSVRYGQSLLNGSDLGAVAENVAATQ